jgi:hypothetical protein
VALDASEDLATAAASLHRLGTLTSGMWRALARELATAAERLDRQTQEHLDEVQRRARALDVDPDAVMAAGMAAAHLEEHRETLGAQLPKLEHDVRRLAAPEVLLGFSVDDEVLLGDDEDLDATDAGSDAAESPHLAIRIWLFMWSAPLTPARVTIVPKFDRMLGPDVDVDTAVDVEVEAADAVRDALTATCGLSGDEVLPLLSTLGLACWSAHQLDERGEEDEADDDSGSDDTAGDA